MNPKIQLLSKLIIIYSFSLFISGSLLGKPHQSISSHEVVNLAFDKGLEEMEISTYPGTLMLHGMSEFALLGGNTETLEKVVSIFEKFGSGEIRAKGNFISYEAGGSGAAYLVWQKAAKTLDQQVAAAAEKMMQEQKRSTDGLMTVRHMSHQVFIDVAFAVTPYLLYSGLKFDKSEYVDYAIFQTLESFRILKDEKTGLLHQGRGFQGEGKVSEDNWSRGNGWGAFALAILVRDLPESHPKYIEVTLLAKQFFEAVLKFQNSQGLWHQEMTDPTSYVETSGSGILLYSLGIMIEKGILPQSHLEKLKKGLSNYLNYIGTDGSVGNACIGCLCPGKGTKEDYKYRKWMMNDYHAFGPVVLAFTQAIKLGIDDIEPSNAMGHFVGNEEWRDDPRTYVRSARGRDVAWENDRIAFRVFGKEVRDKVGSGIDVWAKSVDYPILDKWYQLNDEGKNYHVDRGEGCDFYNMGRLIGCGALAIWKNGKPHVAETFDEYEIISNDRTHIAFDLEYHAWNVPEMDITEHKRIEMEMNNNLFKVTSTIISDRDQEITIAVGLTNFVKAQVDKGPKQGILSIWEQVDPAHGHLGTVVLVNPKQYDGYASYNGDEFILIKVKTNTPFTYYTGAGWDKSKYFETKADWDAYIRKESKKVKF